MHLEKQEEGYLSSFDKNLDEHLRNELNHDEPTVKNFGNKKNAEIKLKDERDKIKSLR